MASRVIGRELLHAVTPLSDAVDSALRGDAPVGALPAVESGGRRDEALALTLVHDLHLAPVQDLGERARFQHHPAMAALKQRLEARYLGRLPAPLASTFPVDAVAEMRAIARTDLVPPIYQWLAELAPLDALRDYIALEGGPDGGFDDFVALCQVGLDGDPKLELATNYWDEMGRGTAADVHTELHRRMAAALDLRPSDLWVQPVEVLERSLLGTTLATNRYLQAELVGALGLIELQAGPRCRRMVEALERLGVAADAIPFYAEHAVADPRHGKDWLDRVVAPLAVSIPEWAPRIVHGARLRAAVNRQFFAMAAHTIGVPTSVWDTETIDLRSA